MFREFERQGGDRQHIRTREYSWDGYKFRERYGGARRRDRPLYRVEQSCETAAGERASKGVSSEDHLRLNYEVDTVVVPVSDYKRFVICCCGREAFLKFSWLPFMFFMRKKKVEVEDDNVVTRHWLPPILSFLKLSWLPFMFFMRKKKVEVEDDDCGVGCMEQLSWGLCTVHKFGLMHRNRTRSQNFNKVLYGCPVLEDLHTSIYYTDHVRLSTNEFKILTNVTRANIHALKVPLKVIPNVRFLVLKFSWRLHEGDMDSYYIECPVFQNLIHIELGIYALQNWEDIVELLQCCPKLQILSIKKSAMNRNLSINWTYPNHVPECISSHLRSCTINYEGWKDELRFTKYILQNARLLEVMKINITLHFNQKPDRRPLDELSSCPMISSECKLLIDF
ncbi:hypothetical protein TSUD_181050 [Trifolium subterraneum]|uniref:FBD domain-containing protein n=1 Tax=Trifolium subterraneum TaxID=3900 RepID=A0A2Z6LXU4_TRISU|nr:hypothetical protein TSUD_181050 [Trifolium subterraneum]